ncbi:MAG: DUF192 domain-containing protein [Vicinamibacterales bacterium]
MARRHSPHFLDGITRMPHAFTLRLRRTAALLVTRATLAGDSHSRREGLLKREALSDDEALVIVPTQGIHTFGMRFAIDVVWVDRRGTVVGLSRDVPPKRIRLSWRAFAAVELAAGRIDALGLVRGDRLEALPS